MPPDRNGATPPVPDEGDNERRADRDARLFEDLLFLVDNLHALEASSDEPGQAATTCTVSPSASPPESDLEPTTPEVPSRIGRYEVLRTLGVGGFGVVSLARDTRLKHLVALKVPRAELLGSRSARQRFITEARAAAALDHAGIVHIFDSDTIGPISYIAYAFVAGPTLSAWLESHTRAVPFKEAARFVAKLADALAHAHGRNVLHRDLKPANVLLHPSAETNPDTLDDYQPRIADFGLAKLMEAGEQDQTGTGPPLGSPPYMAPEQAAGRSREVGRHTDIYALGAILYEIVTHRPAFRGESSLETLRLVLETEPLAPRALRPGLPRDLETIILKCMAKKPEKRYATADALEEDLNRFLNDQPIRARPVPRWEHAARWIKRRPLAASALGIAALALTGVVAVVLWSNAWLRGHNSELEHQKGLLAASVREADRQREFADRNYYGSRLQIAQRAHADGHVRLAQTTLRELSPGPDSPDHREFAWRHLWDLSRTRLAHLTDLEVPHTSISMSEDGRTLAAVADRRGIISVWDVPGRRPLFEVPRAAGFDVKRTTFSVNAEEPRLAVLFVSEDDALPRHSHYVEVWEARTGRSLARLPITYDETALSCAFLADGERLAVDHDSLVNASRRITVWDLGLDDEPRRAPYLVGEIEERFPRFVAFSEKRTSVSPETGFRLITYDMDTLAPINTIEGVTGGVRAVEARAPNEGRFVIEHRGPGRCWLRDLQTGPMSDDLAGLTDLPARAALQPHGSAILVIDTERATMLCDPTAKTTRELYPKTPIEAHEQTEDFAFSSDGRFLALARERYAQPSVIEIRGMPEGDLLARLDAPQMGTAHIGFGPNGESLVIAVSRSVWLWDWAGSGREVDSQIKLEDEAWALAFSLDSATLVTGSNDSSAPNRIRTWETASESAGPGWIGHQGMVSDLAYAADGKMLASSALDANAPVRLWAVPSVNLLNSPTWPEANGARAVALSHDGRVLAAAGNKGGVRLWELPSLRIIATIPTKDRVHDVAFHPSQSTVAAIDDDHMTWIIDAATGQVRKSWRDSEIGLGLAFSPDGTKLARADRGGSITLRDTTTWDIQRRITSEDVELRALAFSPDGRTLASGGMGRVVRLWDPVTGQLLLTLEDHKAQINALAFSPDGNTLASGDHAGIVKLRRAGPMPTSP